MKHLGDITKLNGWEVPIVDVLTGGSPCQDLSVAGKRAGLAGERSGLFMDQMRLTREMRKHDQSLGRTAESVRPRWVIWENVPGALSSPGGEHKGEDFGAVLEEIVKTAEPGAAVSVPVPDTGWPKSGCLYSEAGTWSIAWRIVDAQYWGTPQRRKRIALVADLNGLGAPAVLFDYQYRRETPDSESDKTEPGAGTQDRSPFRPLSEGLSGDTQPGGEAGEGVAKGTADSPDSAIGFTNRGFESGDVSETIRAECHGALPCISFQEKMTIPIEGNGGRPSHFGDGYGKDGDPSFTLNTTEQHAVFSESHAIGTDIYNGQITGEVAASLTANSCQSSTHSGPTILSPIGADIYNGSLTGDTAATITAAVGGTNTSGCKVLAAGFKPRQSAQARSLGYEDGISPTINTDENYAVCIENHPNDSRVKIREDGVCQTLSGRMGTGGNNTPLVMKAYGISSFDSNAMKSPNPHSGIYEADTSRTLDLNGGSPACNQGGVLVLNDQGGSVMRESYDVTATLRANDKGHPPLVMESVSDTLVFDESQITSPVNGNVPKWNDPTHTLSGEAGRAVVIIKDDTPSA